MHPQPTEVVISRSISVEIIKSATRPLLVSSSFQWWFDEILHYDDYNDGSMKLYIMMITMMRDNYYITCILIHDQNKKLAVPDDKQKIAYLQPFFEGAERLYNDTLI